MTPRVTLVTGATGFIGRHLVGALIRDHRSVRVLVRSRAGVAGLSTDVDVVVGDITDPEAVRRAVQGCETIFHLAGRAHELHGSGGDLLHGRVTVDGTRIAREGAREAGVKSFVFASSVAVYGRVIDAAITENAPCRPTTAYGRAKLEAERLVLGEGAADWHAVALRFAAVYGRGCKGHLPMVLRMMRRGTFPPLAETAARRSFVHVDDAVRALLLAAGLPQAGGRIYNVTDGRAYSVRQIYEATRRLSGRRIPRWNAPLGLMTVGAAFGDFVRHLTGRRLLIDRERMEKLVDHAWFSSERLSRELGYRPSRDLLSSLAEVLDPPAPETDLHAVDAPSARLNRAI